MSGAFSGFIGRVIAYTLVIGLTVALAQYMWAQLDLDQSDEAKKKALYYAPLIPASVLLFGYVVHSIMGSGH